MDKRTTILLASIAIIGLVIGGVGFVLADTGSPVSTEAEEGVEEYYCQGLGPFGVMHGNGFWSTFSDEQRDELNSTIAALLEEGATHDEIHEAISGMLEEWGIEPPLFSGPHYGWNGTRGGYDSGRRFGGMGSYGRNGGFGGRGRAFGGMGQRYNGQGQAGCPMTIG